MNCLIVFYSRNGSTKKVGESLALLLEAKTDEIIDKKERKGFINWFICGKDAAKRAKTEIAYKNDPGNFDLVVIGTPVWAGRMAPAIRTYIEDNKTKFQKVCFFCTQGGKNPAKTLTEMEEILQKPCLKESFQAREVKKDLFLEKLEEFASEIKKF